MAFVVAWDVLCDCRGCPRCVDATPSAPECCETAEAILATTQTEVIRELRSWGWAVTHVKGAGARTMCPSCRRKRGSSNEQ